VIVRLQGGLGNQLFQYAFGRSVSTASKFDLHFSIELLPAGNPPRKYELLPWNLPLRFKESHWGYTAYNERYLAYDPGVYTAGNETVFTGYWATEKYFHVPLIRQELGFAAPARNACFIGVRRTDFLASQVHYPLSLDFYKEALRLIPPVERIVFTDDPEWTREHIAGTIANTGSGYEDMRLMASCRYAVIANSTFHWWGAWLGNARKVVGPKRWFREDMLNDIMPERWIAL
jgi:Glycosyl transferase family 11